MSEDERNERGNEQISEDEREQSKRPYIQEKMYKFTHEMMKGRQETLRNDRVDEVKMLELKRFHNGHENEGSSPGQ